MVLAEEEEEEEEEEKEEEDEVDVVMADEDEVVEETEVVEVVVEVGVVEDEVEVEEVGGADDVRELEVEGSGVVVVEVGVVELAEEEAVVVAPLPPPPPPLPHPHARLACWARKRAKEAFCAAMTCCICRIVLFCAATTPCRLAITWENAPIRSTPFMVMERATMFTSLPVSASIATLLCASSPMNVPLAPRRGTPPSSTRSRSGDDRQRHHAVSIARFQKDKQNGVWEICSCQLIRAT